MSDAGSDAKLPENGPDRLAQLREMYGDVGVKFIEDLDDVAPDFGRLILDVNMAVLNRPGLAKRNRELVVIGVLTALGTASRQLRAHIVSALDLGVSSEEIAEAMIQTAVYAGMPSGFNGLMELKQVLEERT